MFKQWLWRFMFWGMCLAFFRIVSYFIRSGRVPNWLFAIAIIAVSFVILCIVMMKTMFAAADVSESVGDRVYPVESHSIPKDDPPVDYKKIASDIGTEAELRELERKEQEELKRLERESRKG
ncbi:MAG: hypothetical protein ACRC9L_08355 [Brevinema sp.]